MKLYAARFALHNLDQIKNIQPDMQTEFQPTTWSEAFSKVATYRASEL